VGKSSLINSLKRTKACNVGATPGVTKSMQEVQLDSKVKLLDSPGLVMAGGNRNDASVALRNAIKVESLEDPITPVVAILARVPRNHLMLQYNLGNFKDCSEFLALLATQMGKLKRGGIPDREKAARIILGDWNAGKIKYFTHPPEVPESSIQSEIVAQFAAEFNLDKLDQSEEMDTLPNVKPSDIVQVETGGILDKAADLAEKMEDDNDDEDVSEDDVENDENLLPQGLDVVQEKRTKSKKEKKESDDTDAIFKIEGNIRMKKAAKLQQKKNKKNARRADKLAAGLSDQMEAAFSSMTEDYDFATDFAD